MRESWRVPSQLVPALLAVALATYGGVAVAAELTGTGGDDTMTGTSSGDVLRGLAGHDTLSRTWRL
jgi:hypothetical protein